MFRSCFPGKNQKAFFKDFMKKEKIAIIGIGMIVPKALNRDGFWQNVLDGRNCITEVPKSHWDSSIYYSPDRKAEDKTYTKIGGFIEGFQFNSVKYRIPPMTARHISRLQQMAIEASHEALQDAGYDKKPFQTARVAAVFGNSLGPIRKDKNDFRVYRFKIEEMLKECPSFANLSSEQQTAIIREYDGKVATIAEPINGDTLPGELSNVIAGRIANVFNLNGPNFTTDAACASSLAALDYAVSGLREHKFDAVITGGADDMTQPTAFVRFSKMGALSADGSFAFDERANGFVLAEAVSVYILKRLSDAERDGDKIYALIDAVGSSSDGKGKGIAAPNPKGQKLAIEHAFSQVEFTPGDIDFIEAHGTATKVGDAAEVQVLDEEFSPFLPEGKKIGLTSVKSQIGHAKSAAGAVSIAKTALALSKKVLPGSINCEKENPAINLEKFYVIKKSSEWKKEEGLRRAAVSAFGFGGTNFHVLMEEYTGRDQDHFVGREEPGPEGYFSPAMVKEDPCMPFDKLQPEAITIWGDTPADVIRAAQREAREIFSRMPSQYPLAVYAQQSMARPQKKFGVSIVAKSAKDFCDKAEILAKKANPEQWEAPLTQFKLKQIYPFITKQNKAKVGLLFPGQGSQSVNMLRDLAAKYRVVKETFDEADSIMMRMIGVKLTEAIWSKPGEDKAALQRREDAIRQTKLTQPAMMTADIAMYRLLCEYGIKPDMAIGHSLGEYAAATAAGVFTFENGLRAVTDRAKEMSNINVADVGKMAFVAMGCDKVDEELAKLNSGYVVSANKNCPTQTVIAGETKAVIDAIAHFKAMGIEAGEIAVSHAFHSAIMAPAMVPYRSFLQKIPINLPSLPILSNVTSDFYPNDKQGIYDILVQQIASPVEFIKQLEHMYDLGVRTFIECGPKRVLTGFATATLKDKTDVTILASNHPKRGGIIEFGDMLANMTALGIPVDWNGKEPISGERHYNSYYRNWALANVATGFAAGGRDVEPEQEKPAVPPETPKTPENKAGITPEQLADLLNTVADLQEKIKKLASSEKSAEKKTESIAKQPEISSKKEEKAPETIKKVEIPAENAAKSEKKTENVVKTEKTEPKTEKIAEIPAKKAESANIVKKTEQQIADEILALFIEKTGYPKEMLEPDVDMEADLGIDTIKQAEILSELRERYAIPADGNVSVKDYPTINSCIKYVFEKQTGVPSESVAENVAKPEIPAKNDTEDQIQPETKTQQAKTEEIPQKKEENPAVNAAPVQPETVKLLTEEEITTQIIDLFIEQTGYAKEMLELDLDMEADLGIDTIKQAEILAILREKYKLPADNSGAIKDYPTIRHCIKFVLENQNGTPREHSAHKQPSTEGEKEPESDPEPASSEKNVIDTETVQSPSEDKVADGQKTTDSLESEVSVLPEKQDSDDNNSVVRESGSDDNKVSPEKTESEAKVVANEEVKADSSDKKEAKTENLAENSEKTTENAENNVENDKISTEKIEKIGISSDNEEKTEENAEISSENVEKTVIITENSAENVQKDEKIISSESTENIVKKGDKSVENVINHQKNEQADPIPVRHIRYIPEIIQAVSDQENIFSLPYKKPVIIISEDINLAKTFRGELKKRYIPSFVFTTKKNKLKDAIQYDSSNPDDMEMSFRAFASSHNDVSGIIYLNGCIQKTLDSDTRPMTDLLHYACPLFLAVKVFKPILERNQSDKKSFLAIVTTANGSFGYAGNDGEVLDPIYGAIYGMSLCLRKELPNTLLKIIDFAPSEKNDYKVRKTMNELLYSDCRVAVSFKDGKRYAMIANPDILKKENPLDLKGKKVIITGGGRGLGAVFAKMMAEQHGAIPIIIGKMSPDVQNSALVDLSETEKNRWKNETLYPEMLAASPDHSVTPVELETEYRKRLHSAELKRNLDQIKAICPDTVYYKCDISDGSSFRETLEQILSDHGIADGLVHFAGIEHSHRIEDKTALEFSQVFAVKAASAITLWKHGVVRPGGFFAFASSVIGRFGNLGQCDYAAASAYLSSFANELHKKGIRAVAADMSAFSDIGMSTRESVRKYLEGCGVEFLSPEEGMQAMLDEIVYGKCPEVIFSAALGSIDTDHQLSYNPGFRGNSSMDLPLLPYIQQFNRGHDLIALKTYSVPTDPYLEDHVVGKNPYIPGIMGLEGFAEAVCKMRGQRPDNLRDIHFRYPIKIFPQRPEAEVITKAVESPDGILRMSVQTESNGINGRKHDAVSHFTGAYSSDSVNSRWIAQEKPQIPSDSQYKADRTEIYDSFFQGPRMRVLDGIISCDEKTVFAMAKLPEKTLWQEKKDMFFMPLVFEAMFQCCAWRDLKYENMIYLPMSIRTALINPEMTVPNEFYVLGRLTEKTDEGNVSVYDAWAFDGKYRLLAEMQGYSMMPTKEL